MDKKKVADELSNAIWDIIKKYNSGEHFEFEVKFDDIKGNEVVLTQYTFFQK